VGLDREAQFRGVLFESSERFPFYVQVWGVATHSNTLYNKIGMLLINPIIEE